MSTHSCRLLTSFVLFSGLAAAQAPLVCTMNAGVAPAVRVEGVAEEVGQVVISCTGGTPTAAGQPIPTVNIDATLNTNVTSRLLDPSGTRSEALLLLDEPQPAEQVEASAVPFAGSVTALGGGQYKGPNRPNVFGAQQITPTSLRWSNIPFDPPGNGVPRILRLVNVRANASALGAGGIFSPSLISMNVSATSPVGVSIASPTVTVAAVVAGMILSTAPSSVQQCSPGTYPIPIIFSEMFGSAFRHAAAASSQNSPGTIYNTESMFFSNAFTGIGVGAGKASQGTRLRAVFSNVPANVTISVPVSGSNAAGDAASLVAVGVGGSTANASTGVVALSAGSGTAVWEVTASNVGNVSTLTFNATATYSAAPLPGLGSITVVGGFAPVASTFVASTEAAPRFVQGVSSVVTPLTISACGAATVSLSSNTAAFTATAGGSAISPAQDITVTASSGAITSWSASSDSAWLAVTPGSGTPGGALHVSIVAASLPAAGVYTGKITVVAPGASNSPVFLNCTLTVTAVSGGVSKIIKVSGDGQLTMLGNGFTVPMVVKVVDAAGAPIAGKPVTWTQQGGVNFSGSNGNTVTDSNGLAQVVAVPGGFFNPGTPFLVYSITATTDIGAAVFNMTSYPVTGATNYNPPPMITLVKPAQGSFTISAQLGSTTVDTVRVQVLSGGGNATNPTPIPGVALNVSTSNTDPAAGVVARCAGGTPLSDVNGFASCDLIVEGRVGNAPLLVNIGALRDFPGVQLTVTGGTPVAPIILQGNGQTGKPGAMLPVSLVVRIADAFGNPLPATPVAWLVVPNVGGTLLNASTQSDVNGNASAQVQLGSTPGVFQVWVKAGGKESIFTLTVEGAAPSVTLSLSRTALVFGANGSGSAVTSPQDVILTVAGGSNNWTAISNRPWLGVTPGAGTGSTKFSVFIVPSALPALGTYVGAVTVNATGATNGPLTLTCTLTVKSGTTVPFGVFETPVNNLTGISGGIAVTGWALDDLGVKKLTIWRDPIGAEQRYPNGYVYIGDALFVPGARPDVEAQFKTNPIANRAVWGYMMLTNALPGSGNGVFKLRAIAVDEEGNQTELGNKTITVDNAHSIKPFGALDNPQPGQTISGTITDDGWALTPQPALIAADGSTIWVNVDGVNIGHPAYGLFRGDVASLFPGYANSSGSLGQYSLNSTNYLNGMHTIAWIVYDNLGHGDGIGSRFFNIQNGVVGANAGTVPVLPAAAEIVEADRTIQLRAARMQRAAVAPGAYPAFKRGYDLDAALVPVRQGGEGLLTPIEIPELDHLEIHLAAGQAWTAGLRVGDELRELPIGSTFDAEGGIFYWQLGPGFLGEYTLEFRAEDGTILSVPVFVGARTIPAAIQ
ncbi:MAG: Ig-like domain-containing protein [Bryobacterales bacterium]|nr:Ig-like domain-containing protein [Bryobacterales bacterium]